MLSVTSRLKCPTAMPPICLLLFPYLKFWFHFLFFSYKMVNVQLPTIDVNNDRLFDEWLMTSLNFNSNSSKYSTINGRR